MLDGSIFSIRLGLPGSGKSLGLVEEDLLPHLLAGEEVWCNFWVNWKGDNLHFFNNEEFEELVPNLRNCVLVMDEIGQVLEPRAWEQESGNTRRFFQLHRHHHVDIYGTTQDISLVAKSAWIVVDEWILCHKEENGIIDKIINFLVKDNTFKVGYQEMTYQELKKLSYGWENGEFSDNYDGIGGNIRVKRYFPRKLIHNELNKNKLELKHYFCKKCAGRQDKTEDLKCPKHKDIDLIEIESGIYDSDYDLPTKEREIYLKVFTKGDPERLMPYKGVLTDKQLRLINEFRK